MTDEEDEIAPVIQLRPGQDVEDDARPVDSGDRYRTPFCTHRQTRLDREARRVYCRECDREVPAFDALLAIAYDWENIIYRRKEAERRSVVTQGNLEELLRDERNAKSRIRSARKRSDPEAVVLLRSIVSAYRLSQRKNLAAAISKARVLLDRLDQAEMAESGALHPYAGDDEEDEHGAG